MIEDNRPTQIRRIILGILILYWVTWAAATHMPIPTNLVTTVKVKMLPIETDKIVHCLAYAGLTFLCCTWWSLGHAPRKIAIFAIIFLVLTHGAIEEFTQSAFARTPDINDWYADLTGTVIGVISFAIIWRIIKRFSVQEFVRHPIVHSGLAADVAMRHRPFEIPADDDSVSTRRRVKAK